MPNGASFSNANKLTCDLSKIIHNKKKNIKNGKTFKNRNFFIKTRSAKAEKPLNITSRLPEKNRDRRLWPYMKLKQLNMNDIQIDHQYFNSPLDFLG